jgi:putative ATP-dependent endonuclease of the OLD family
MRLLRMECRNYRTLENLDLEFPSFYSAICGRNDSGKTNVVRALRGLMREEDPYGFRPQQDLTVSDDYPKWKTDDPKARRISIALQLDIAADADAALHQFVTTHLQLPTDSSQLHLTVKMDYGSEENDRIVTIEVAGQVFPGLAAQEVLRKLQASPAFLFYNSTEPDPRYRLGRGFYGFFRELSVGYASELSKVKDTLNKKIKKAAKDQQKQLTELLGRLETKYRAGLSIPAYEFDYLPFNLTLSDGKAEVGIDEWGSGTRNRTLIFLTLFRARQVSQSASTSSKVTPVIVVEEPESFLHPSAQAEFGRILQDLASDFKVQVVTTTHSPYLLSQQDPGSNILLDRRMHYHQRRDTLRLDTTGPNWMEPFGLALGIDGQEFKAWHDLFFAKAEAILLVEGETDKEYFELLRDPNHGQHQLRLSGEVFPYGGKDTLKQTVLLKFIKERYRRLFVTFDLDAREVVEKSLQAVGLQQGSHYAAVGLDEPGKRSIEGLLPDAIKTTVRMANPALVDQTCSDNQEERREAVRKLKRLYLNEFKAKAEPGAESYGGFYPLVKSINRALASVDAA